MLPPPTSWGHTLQERTAHASYAQRARHYDLAPLTTTEVAARANPYVMRDREFASNVPWPQIPLEPGMVVQVHGLQTRRDLDDAFAQVTGLCHVTQRIGIRLADHSVINVLIQRLSPVPATPQQQLQWRMQPPQQLAAQVQHEASAAIIAACPPPRRAAEPDAIVAEGPAAVPESAVAIDQVVSRNLQAVILSFVKRYPDDGLGVSFDTVVSSLSSLAPRASVEDFRCALELLVHNGDCYSTNDEEHFLAL